MFRATSVVAAAVCDTRVGSYPPHDASFGVMDRVCACV